MTSGVLEPNIDLDVVDCQLASGHSIPYNWYVDPAIFRAEMDNIWRQSWQAVAPLAKLANAGDHVACDVAGVPIVITRGVDDVLRAFVNVCRHRAYPVVRENGNRKTLQCQYHAWTYNLDGTLKSAPGCQLDATFKKEELSLAPVSVDTISGVVFVNVDPDAPSLRDSYPTLQSWTDKLELDLQTYRWVKRLTFGANGNWKLVYENASECYHCSTIHPTSLTSVYDSHGEREICDGQLVIAHAPRLDRDGQGIRAIMGFPGFVVQQDDWVGISAQIVPDESGRTRFIADIYANPTIGNDELETHFELWERTFQEDMDVVDLVSRGISSRRLPFGRLIAQKEERTAHIQRVLVEAYRRAAALGGAAA